MSSLLDTLNDSQRQAVTHGEGPLMIVAGAGTGKTTVITRRIAWLMETGKAMSGEILALTFTEKAAGEMEERVDELLPIGHLDLAVHTFHAFCERLLREYGVEIGLSRTFDVFTETDAWLLLHHEIERFALDYYKPLGNPTRHLRDLLKHFAAAKEQGVWPEDYRAYVENRGWRIEDGTEESDRERLMELARAYETYEQILHEHDALDFGGLILYTLKLLRERPMILRQLQERYRYILVDEFQDTNAAQYELVRLLAAPRNNLTVVGDDDQSIYRFRGASLSNILQFSSDYPTATHVVLTDNYRSHQEILDAAHAFIQKNNPRRLEVRTGLSKKLSAARKEGGEVRHFHEATLEDEVEKVLEMILESREKDATLQWKDFAVLVRANDHAEPFVELFERHGIPHHFLAMNGLYGKPVVLDVLSWLKLLNDPYDAASAYRVFSHPASGLSVTDIQHLLHASRKQGKTLLFLRLGEGEDLSQEGKGVYEKILETHRELSELARRKRATEMMVFTARQSGILAYLQSLPEETSRDEFRWLQQFYQRIRRFESHRDDRSLHAFLEEFARERHAGETGELDFDVESGPDTVRIMTVHASKGLEFRQVFVVNLVDRRFPTQQRESAIPLPEGLGAEPLEPGEHVEEERRLLYVAMTRAKEKLYLTSAEDYGGVRKKKPSVFLQELGLGVSGEDRGRRDEKRTNFFERDDGAPFQKKFRPFSSGAHQPLLEIQLPKFLSFTQLEAYRNCPLQYKFAHVLHIPILGNHQMSFGKSMHGALQQFFECWIKEGALPSMEKLLELYRDGWVDDWYPDDVMRETYREEGKASLEKLHERFVKSPPKPFAVEQPFTLPLGGVIMKGQMDRVDEVEGGLHILDYKTGTPKTKEDLHGSDRDQLLIYQMAAEAIWQKPVVRLTYFYLRDQSAVDFVGTEKDKERLLTDVERVVEGMKAGAFQPTPGWHCRTCDFREICPYRAE